MLLFEYRKTCKKSFIFKEHFFHFYLLGFWLITMIWKDPSDSSFIYGSHLLCTPPVGCVFWGRFPLISWPIQFWFSMLNLDIPRNRREDLWYRAAFFLYILSIFVESLKVGVGFCVFFNYFFGNQEFPHMP